MISFIKANIWTIVVALAVIIMVAFIIKSLVRDKKAGKSLCGGDCKNCCGCPHNQ